MNILRMRPFLPSLPPRPLCPAKLNLLISDMLKKDLTVINKQTDNMTQTKAEVAKSQQVKEMTLFVHA